MSSVFGTGQSTNSMARIMKANQMSKVCASSHEYPHVEKIKDLCEQNFKGTVAQPTVTAKELTARKKEKPQGKKKNKKNLTAKRENTHSKIFLMPRGHFLFFFLFICREGILFAVSLFLLVVRFFFVFLFALWFFFLP